MVKKARYYLFLLSIFVLISEESFTQLSIEQLLYPKFESRDDFVNYRKKL
ncbi:MAG: hypothetical protein ABIM62_06725 [candidate division WOR-3 bacterium]